jgi:hypothetical protein
LRWTKADREAGSHAPKWIIVDLRWSIFFGRFQPFPGWGRKRFRLYVRLFFGTMLLNKSDKKETLLLFGNGGENPAGSDNAPSFTVCGINSTSGVV